MFRSIPGRRHYHCRYRRHTRLLGQSFVRLSCRVALSPVDDCVVNICEYVEREGEGTEESKRGVVVVGYRTCRAGVPNGTVYVIGSTEIGLS